jgi:hypothetical protein
MHCVFVMFFFVPVGYSNYGVIGRLFLDAKNNKTTTDECQPKFEFRTSAEFELFGRARGGDVLRFPAATGLQTATCSRRG